MKNLNGLIGLPGPVATKICMRCILENWVRTRGVCLQCANAPQESKFARNAWYLKLNRLLIVFL